MGITRIVSVARDGPNSFWRFAGSAVLVGSALAGLKLFPGLSDAMLAAAAKPFKSLLEQATGVSGTIVQGGSAQGLGSKDLVESVNFLGRLSGADIYSVREP